MLDSPAVPRIERWRSLESRAPRNLERILAALDDGGVKTTFFWLGWLAERYAPLVQACAQAGHEIASHGYAHVLPGEVGLAAFKEDVVRAKKTLEDITGRPVPGFRAPGFGVNEKTAWALDVVREAGHEYDTSIFPANHGHGGAPRANPTPFLVHTRHGPLVECPVSVVEAFGRRVCLFGGGYLRLAPLWLIKWGVRKLESEGRPLIVYLHPRDIDPDTPRLPLGLKRRFKCYVGLKSTMRKLEWLCHNHEFVTMSQLSDRVLDFHKDRPRRPNAEAKTDVVGD